MRCLLQHLLAVLHHNFGACFIFSAHTTAVGLPLGQHKQWFLRNEQVTMGLMLQSQNQYLGGHAIVKDLATAQEKAKACFIAAGSYIVFILLSGLCWIRGVRQERMAK